MADEVPQFNTLKFSRMTQSALEFYNKGASEEEKLRVSRIVRRAARRLKRAERGTKERAPDSQDKTAPSPEAKAERLAAGLYRILSESDKVKVKGDPSSGAPTRIQGPVDLNEVARKLLSLGS